jgi:predicted transcriptional regulator of viral defense system
VTGEVFKMAESTITAQIQKLISLKKPGTIFTARDFGDVADNTVVRQNLKRLAEKGSIRRIARGIYDKPIYSFFLNEYESADIYQAAQTIVRTYNWTIFPSGNTALNMLGLSTQVSSTWSFVSDGPYKKYTIGSNTIEFRHRTNRELSGMSEKTVLVIQAFKTLGKDQVTDSLLFKIQKQITDDEKKKLLEESRTASQWIIRAVKKICGERIQCTE